MQRVLFFTHEIDYAGTWRSHERIIEALDTTKYEAYVAYAIGQNNNRLGIVEKLLGPDRLISYRRTTETMGKAEHYHPKSTDFESVIMPYNFDIIHYARSGYQEWPFTRRLAGIQIETNIFGHRDRSPYLDGSIAISRYVARLRGGADAVIYNPIPDRIPGTDLRRALGIPQDAIVCGRIGRAANYDPIALQAYEQLAREYHDLYYIIIDPQPEVLQWKLEKLITVGPTNDDDYIGAFYRTIDLFLHYRSDGETHGTAIAQAMMYGKPVVSHLSSRYNAQTETIGDGGFVVATGAEYVDYTRRLLGDPELRMAIGKRGRRRALEHFEQQLVVRRIMDFYARF